MFWIKASYLFLHMSSLILAGFVNHLPVDNLFLHCFNSKLTCRSCFILKSKHISIMIDITYTLCGFTFIGGHPMAGTQYSGYKYSRANMFHGAPMVIVPPSFDNIELLSYVKEMLSPLFLAKDKDASSPNANIPASTIHPTPPSSPNSMLTK